MLRSLNVWVRTFATFTFSRLIQNSVDNQHTMLAEIMGRYVPPLEAIMAEDIPGETKAILDLGCGSGSWFVHSQLFLRPLIEFDVRIMQAAHDFPHCSAVAVDLVPMQSPYV